ncbi:MAG: hypothetical protein RLZZ332_1053, partial [Actinomycetota bacterium]
GGTVTAPSQPTFSLNTANQEPGDFVLSGFNSSATLLVSIGFVSPPTGTTFTLPTTSGLTAGYGYNFTGGKTQISFTGTQANANAALAAMTVTTGGTTGNITIRVTATVNSSNVYYNPINDSFYEYVASSGITANSADSAARLRTLNGVRGYLVSITDSQENSFVASNVSATNVWIGLSDATQEGSWRIMDGPLAGVETWRASASVTNATTSMYSSAGSNQNGYAAVWCSSEPNNADGSTGEDYAVTNWGGGSCWNDLRAGNSGGVNGYVVEYSQNWGSVGAYTGIASASVTALVSNAPRSVTAARASPAASGEIAVSWLAPLGGTVTGYTATSSTGSRTCTTTGLTCTVTGLTNGTSYTFTVTATFSSGSPATSLASNSISPADEIPPTASVGSATVAAGSSVSVSISLSESSTTFTSADVSATGGALSSFTGSGTSYSVTFTPYGTSAGSGTVTVASGSFSDAAGNLNASSASGTVTITNTLTSSGGRTSFTGNGTIGVNGRKYIVERFTTTGSTTWTAPQGVTAVDLLVVGGGGGGAGRHGGGGGAGGFVEATSYSVTPGSSYAVTIGAGGSGAASRNDSTQDPGQNGSASTFLLSGVGVTANGGNGATSQTGAASGSGSGGSVSSGNGGAPLNGSCGSSDWCGGGGGGAGGTGSSASATGGAGGAGKASSISGTSVTYAGGGGGGSGSSGQSSCGSPTSGGSGGTGGGGAGGTASGGNATAGTAGSANTGSGGGGGGYCDAPTVSGAGGAGGSGIVVVRYELPTVANLDLHVDSDTGTLTTDNLTSVTTLKVTGSAPVGSTVQLQAALADASGVAISAYATTGSTCTANSSTGSWECTTATLSPNLYVVRAVSSTYVDNSVFEQTSSTLAVTIDTTVPTVTATRAGTTSLLVGQTDTITFTLSESSTNFVLEDVTVAGGSLSSFTGSGTSYTATFTPTGSAAGTASISVAINKFTDTAGNNNSASTALTFAYDTVAPTASVTTATVKNTASVTTAQSTETGTVYLVLSSMTVSNLASITGAADASWNSATVTTANTNTSISAAGLSDGTYKVYSADSAGNLSAASTGTITVDTTAPTVSITRSGSGTLKSGQTTTITFTLSESSSNFVVGDVTVTGGALSSFAGSGITYTATFTPTASSSGTASLSVDATKFTDTATNDNVASTALSIVYDTAVPTISLAGCAESYSSGATCTITITLSEEVTDLVAADFTVSRGSISGLTTSGTTRTATYTTSGDSGSGTISVASGAFTDIAGNSNTVSNTLSVSAAASSVSLLSSASSSGVLVSDGASGSSRYIVRSFTGTGTAVWTVPAGVTSINYLVVGGGASGTRGWCGYFWGHGGGGGGVSTGTLSVTPGASYSVTVGAGGAGATQACDVSHTGNNGGTSKISTGGTDVVQATGGIGASWNQAVGGASGTGTRAGTVQGPFAGGSGGGGAFNCPSPGLCGAGGGGGAGGSGSGLNGGIGVTSAITGSSVMYGSGGSGRNSNAHGSYYSASGVLTSGTSVSSRAGDANTGQGGTDGVSGVYSSYSGGGSGIVVVRYLVPAPTTPDLSAANDSGALDSDNITSARTLTFSGTSAVSASVQLSYKAASSTSDTVSTDTGWTNVGSACTADANTGAWSCTTAELTAGQTYKFRATATATVDGQSDTQTSATALPVTIDTTAPTIASFSSSTADGSYKAGQSVTITATASEAVQVNNTITVTLETGATDRTVVLTAASAGTSLTGTYTVQAGDTTSDLTVSSFTIGTMADTAGNAMTSTTVPTGANVADTKAIVIDTTAPTVSNVTSSTANGTVSYNGTVSIQVVFSEAVTVTTTGGTPTITLETGTNDRTASYASGTGTDTLTPAPTRSRSPTRCSRATRPQTSTTRRPARSR